MYVYVGGKYDGSSLAGKWLNFKGQWLHFCEKRERERDGKRDKSKQER